MQDIDKSNVLSDYRLAYLSRQLSLVGRREVLNGKAKFGIFGDGKEVAQIAMAKFFRDGDWRTGYYRDQTFMMAAGLFDSVEFFSQLYGDTDMKNNPQCGGRNMNNHFSTRSLDDSGEWKNLMKQKNTSPDFAPTAGHMPRMLGCAYASKIFRNNKDLWNLDTFTAKGDEVVFGTIGDASTSEGHFWECINAASVLQVPLALAIWDDGYGISVPTKYQTARGDISKLLEGFVDEEGNGILLYEEKGWNYEGMISMFEEGIEKCRKLHKPVVFHVKELTQPQGHSSSGSHERYKSEERLEWEREWDALKKFREWIIENGFATEEELLSVEEDANNEVQDSKKKAWKLFLDPIREERKELIERIYLKSCNCAKVKYIDKIVDELKAIQAPLRKDVVSAAKKILRYICKDCSTKLSLKEELISWLENVERDARHRYDSYLYSESKESASLVKPVKPVYPVTRQQVTGREIINENFDAVFASNPLVLTFGEDTGFIGDVNRCLEGLQEKYGELRVTDTGIREASITGQGIGLALRGLRPIVEIQYFDYLLYALQTMSDDIATTLYRTAGGQKLPLIIRTRGHRLEGIWHAGSPTSLVLNSIRGMLFCVPRDMTQAAGMYNTLLQSDEPALVVEPLNGYRLKEDRPMNPGAYRVPVGVPEILVEGKDITLVTYGSCVKIAKDAIKHLEEFGISVVLIDVQTLLPFDINHIIIESVKKTNRVVFFDEDVPGGTTSYMMHKVLQEQEAWQWLDSEPKVITAAEHRPAYSSDGDYFSNPNSEDVFTILYNIMREANPDKYERIY